MEDHLPLQSAIGRFKSEEVEEFISILGSGEPVITGAELGSGTGSALVGTWLAEWSRCYL